MSGLTLIAASTAQAQDTPRSPRGVVALQQAVEDASHDWLVLLVASHPDDSYLLAAASLRFDYGFNVAVLLATRGEGGQNSEGPETGDALGELRTREAEASADELGIQVRYLNRLDGGYCRSAAEALRLWGRDATVREMAEVIRDLRPDIVLTTHHSGETHGNNLAVLELLPEAVRAAGARDFPPPRLFVGAAPDEQGRDLEALEMDDMDLARGATYRRLAFETLTGNHKSQQPFRSLWETYPETLRFRAVDLPGQSTGPGLYEDLPTLWNQLPDVLDDGTSRLDLVQALDVELKSHLGNTSLLVDRALAIHETLQSIEREPGSELDIRLGRRLEALQRVIRYGCALHVEVERLNDVAVPGHGLPLHVVIHNGESKTLEDVRIATPYDNIGTASGRHDLPTRTTLRLDYTFPVPASWSGDGDPMSALYNGREFQWPVRLVVHYRIDGQAFSFPVEVPVEVRPAVEVFCTPQRLLVPNGLRVLRFALQVRRNNAGAPVRGELSVEAPSGFVVRGNNGDVAEVAMVQERGQTFDFELEVPATLPMGVNVLRIRFGGEVVSEVMVHRVDVAIDPAIRVGLVRGVERSTEEAIRGLGVQLSLLTDEAVLSGSLDAFDSIVVDVRALRGRPRVAAAFGRLLRFSENGGRLLVFYHKDAEFNLETSGFKGYPFEPFHIGRGRVTREDAPVEMDGAHPMLQRPNRIAAADWDGWVQERGLYFPDSYADRYQPLLTMGDPGLELERSALLYAENGEGDYVYCALSLYRQLKNMHPGAVRLFANMLTPR